MTHFIHLFKLEYGSLKIYMIESMCHNFDWD
jgi:hypothetical protein